MPPKTTTPAKQFNNLLLGGDPTASPWQHHVRKSNPTYKALDLAMVCIRADKKTLKLALFLTSHEDKCYFLGTVGTKVQAFYVTHDDLAAVKAAPIQNNKMVKA